MNFDWTEYLGLAQELSGRPARPFGQEALSRTAISRAYYAAFISVRNYLRDVENVSLPIDASVHQVVIKRFTSSHDKQRRQLGHKLNDLRLYRNFADYADRFIDLSGKTR